MFIFAWLVLTFSVLIRGTKYSRCDDVRRPGTQCDGLNHGTKYNEPGRIKKHKQCSNKQGYICLQSNELNKPEKFGVYVCEPVACMVGHA